MAVIQNGSFINSLWDGTVAAVSEGSRSILIWGFGPQCIQLFGRMREHGLDNLVRGVIDLRIEVQGIPVGNILVSPPNIIPSLEVDTLVIAEDKGKEAALLEFANVDSRMPRVIMAGVQHLDFDDPAFREILSSCLVPSRAAGYQNMLVHIYQTLVYIAQRGLDGCFAEFGVYKAGTTVFIAKTLQRLGISSKIYAFDTFGGFPPRKSLLDLYSDSHDEFFDFDAVSAYCEGYPIELVRGDIQETYRRLEGVPLAFSFFDTDNYTPTKAALELCYDQTVPGGVLVFDHYVCDERWLCTLGERIAVNEVLKGKDVLNLHGTGIFLKL